MDKEREELIKELRLIVINEFNGDLNINCPNYEKIADFILADRRRILEPLLREYTEKDLDTYGGSNLIRDAVEETLKLAGVTNE